MPEFTPAKRPDNGEKISRGLRNAMYPKELRVRCESSRPDIVIELDAPGGDGLILSLQGAAVLARELRKTVHAYLNPETADKSDSRGTG